MLKFLKNLILVGGLFFFVAAFAVMNTSLGAIQVDQRFSEDEKELLASDYRAVDEFPFEFAEPTLLTNVLNIKEVSRPEIKAWLERWVRYLLPQGIYLNSPATIDYSHAETVHGISQEVHGRFKNLLENYGLVFFVSGVKLGKLFSIPFMMSPGRYVWIPVKTPAAGVVVVGKAYFSDSSYPTFMPGSTAEPLDLAKRLVRVSGLYHEGGHSRGRGHYTGFQHVACPPSVPRYEGRPACDMSANGGNGIQAAFLHAILSACENMVRQDYALTPSLCRDSESLAWIDKYREEIYSKVLGEEYWKTDPVDPRGRLSRMLGFFNKLH